MNLKLDDCPLEHAVLHEAIFIPGANGKGHNLKNTLSINTIEGQQVGLKMTLMNNFVFIETNKGSAFIPINNFKLFVPMKMKAAAQAAKE